MMRQLALFAVLVLACAGAIPARAAPVERSMEFGGETRTYLVHEPAARPAGLMPLVLVLHGAGGTAGGVRKSSAGEFDVLSDRDGFLLVYPQALGGTWDTGAGAFSNQLAQRRDDLGFLRALIERLARDYPVDRSRVFATGVSRGGQMAFMLACEGGGVVRAVAPVSMTLANYQRQDCAAAPPFGLLVVAGEQDPVVPYGGGEIALRGHHYDHVLSAEDTFAFFQQRNGCTGSESLTAPAGYRDLAGTGCRQPVRLFTFLEGDHGWPNEASAGGKGVIGPDMVWDFFRRF